MKKLVQFDEVALPVAAETAARLVALGDELRVLVNVAEKGYTAQMRVTRNRQVRMLAPLPLMVGGACGCEDGMIVTGSDEQGEPLIAAIADDGIVSWLTKLEGEMPLRWPIPGCGAPARIAWQVEHGMIETATVTAEGVVAHKNFQAGGPPLDVAVAGDVVWAIWSDGEGVWSTESKDATPTRLDERYCSEIAIDAQGEDVWAGWVNDRQIRWARPGKGGQPVTMAAAGDGRLEIVAGEQPIAVMRYAEMEDNNAPRYKTELIVGDADLWSTEELLHSISWWEGNIAATGQRSLYFLKIE